MDPGMIALLSALGGIVIAGFFNLIITLIQKKSENAKELRKLIVSASMDQWKQSVELAKVREGKTELMPPISYIITMSMIADIIGKKSVSDNEIKAFYKERDSCKQQGNYCWRERFHPRYMGGHHRAQAGRGGTLKAKR